MQILRFNWPFYVVGLGVIGVTAIALRSDPQVGLWRSGSWAALILASWWLFVSLLVSHWVYDRSGLFRFEWLKDIFDHPPHNWIHIHAGLDESTELIERELGISPCAVLDIFTPEDATESSIARARKLEHADARTRAASLADIPFPDESLDAVISVFSLHEVRQAATRKTLFDEFARVLRPRGVVVLVEHARDLPNFLAYGPGFLHFLGRSTWSATAAASGFVIARESAVTPFVRVMEMRRT